MKRIFTLLAVISFVGYGCENKDTVPDEYYVRYKLSSFDYDPNGNTVGYLDVTINTEDNTSLPIVVYQRSNFEMTVGPVQKGFEARLEAKTWDGKLMWFKPEISVQKNNAPFRIKVANGIITNISQVIIYSESTVASYTVGD